jgi:hypothetical protein
MENIPQDKVKSESHTLFEILQAFYQENPVYKSINGGSVFTRGFN